MYQDVFGYSFMLSRPAVFMSLYSEILPHLYAYIEIMDEVVHPWSCASAAGLSHPLPARSAAWQREEEAARDEGGYHGSHVSSSPQTQRSSLRSYHPFVSAYRRFTYTRSLVRTPIRCCAASRSNASAVRALPSLTISSLIHLRACIDYLRHKPLGYDSFFITLIW